MTAIIASTVGVKTMADDTLRLTIDIDPRYAGEAFALFGKRGSACAIARLTSESAVKEMRNEHVAEEKLKGGPLAKLSGQLCGQPEFMEWLWVNTPEEAAAKIRALCSVSSRAELDHNPVAAEVFHREIRIPYSDSKRNAA